MLGVVCRVVCVYGCVVCDLLALCDVCRVVCCAYCIVCEVLYVMVYV